ncbi:unnamed protein product [Linum tenue]|uniref:KIB1-4 beta-propeller domain-containing protein n=1 Tax=Linum tenue TaxID=586396 RepID=A0AAV0MH41_9ROSI|nr:unnamed protein product [Linum tenue]
MDAPWLVFSQGQSQIFYSTSNPKHVHRCRIPELVDNLIIGYSQYGWLILRREIDDTATEFSLLNPITLETIRLPSLINSTGRFERGELTLPPTDPNCRVVIADNETPQLAHCKPGGGADDTWTVQTFSEEFGAFCGLVLCRGSLYAVTGNSQLVEITMDANNTLVGKILVDQGPLSLPYTVGSQNWNLVESSGELLWVIVCYRKFSDKELEFVLVYELDKSSMSWVQVNTLNGRAIFISPNRCSFSCPCATSGTKPNCIYFFLGGDNFRKFFAFDVERGQSSQFPLLAHSEGQTELTDDDEDDEPIPHVAFLSYGATAHQTTPQCGLFDETTSEKDVEEAEAEAQCETQMVEEEKQRALILKLPSDILANIAKGLVDYRNFRNCCRTLNSAIPLSPPPYPWLFYFKHYKGNLNFLDLMHGHTHEKQFPESLSDAEVVFSKECWLGMGMTKRIPNPDLDSDIPLRLHITFYNPFTKEALSVAEMIPLPFPSIFGVSAPPTSPDCCIIELCEGFEKGVILSFMRLDDQQLHFFLEADEQDFQPSYHNTPISVDDKFYFLDRERRLGVFSSGHGDEGEFKWTWDVYDWQLMNNAGEPIEDPCDVHGFELEYLVECGGEILAILVSDFGKLVQVYRFNQEHKGWLKVENLGSHALFVSRTACFSTVEKITGMGNKIYFPKVSAKQQNVVFYSLDTQGYHTFHDFEEAMEDFQSSCEIHLSGWIEPALAP